MCGAIPQREESANVLTESVSKSMTSRTIPTSSCPIPSLLSSLAGNATLRATDRREIYHYPSQSNIPESIVLRRVILGVHSNTLQCTYPQTIYRLKEDTGTKDIRPQRDHLHCRSLGTVDMDRSFWGFFRRRMKLESLLLPSPRFGSIAQHFPLNLMDVPTLDTSTALPLS